MTLDANPFVAQADSYGAEQMRRAFSTFINSGGGVVGANDLQVTALSTPNMSVNVSSGQVWVPGTLSTQQGQYYGLNNATLNVPVPGSDPTNPRIDLIAVVVDDAAYGQSSTGWDIVDVPGTPAPSPTIPTAPANSIVLAQIAVNAAVSSITSADITDKRVFAGVDGRIFDSGGQVFNVKAYGAKGDGVTDDSAAIIAANAAASTSGGDVFYPPGSYVKSQGVSVASGVHHVGSGIGATTILGGISDGSDYSFIGTSGSLVSNAGLSNLTLDSQNVSKASCIDMYYFDNLFFDKVAFLNAGFKFVQNDVSTQSTIDNSNLVFRDCTFTGSSAGSTTEGITFANTNLIMMERCAVDMGTNTAYAVLYYQLCTNTFAVQSTFSTGVLTAISCNDMEFEGCTFSGGLITYGVSDHGVFGYTWVEGVTTRNCIFEGVLTLGSSKGYRDFGSTFRNNTSLAVEFGPQSGYALGYDWRFTNSVFRNNNTSGGHWPIVYLPGVADDLGLYLDGCIFDDDQATPTQGGVFQQPTDVPISGVTAINCKFSGGSAKVFWYFGYSTIGSNVRLAHNDGYNPTGPQSAPPVPASGTTEINPFAFDVGVYISGGTVTEIAKGNIPTPAGLALTTATTGGTLSASTSYSYQVTALNSAGETLASTAVSITTGSATSTNTVTATWNSVNGAASYNIYGRTSGSIAKIANVTTPSYTDTGSVSPSGAVPTTDSTGVSTGLTSGEFTVPAGSGLQLTYSAAPSWVWIGN